MPRRALGRSVSQRRYVSVCVTIVILGAFFVVGSLLIDGVPFGDFIPLLCAPLGLIAATRLRRRQE